MGEQLFRTITNLRKEGKLQEAWDLGCPAVQQTPNDNYLKGSFFWVCYDFLKQIQAPIKARALDNGSNYKPNQAELERINFLLDWIIWLEIPPSGFEYRSLLLLFQKSLESIPKLIVLLVKYGDTLFEDEDKIPYQGEKYESPSLMLNFARKVAKAWMESDEANQIDIDQLLSIFEQARSQAKDKQHMMWLDYDEAKCLIMAGRNDEAREFAIVVLRKKQSESWAWGALAATYRTQNADTSIKLFCQGLCHCRDDKYALPLLQGIAPLLADKGFIKEASMCVQRAVNCYKDNGWKIKKDLEKLMELPWFDTVIDVSQLTPFIREKSQGALESLNGPASIAYGLVTTMHPSGKGLHLYLSESESISVPLRIFKGNVKPNMGDYAEVTLTGEGQDKMVISAQLTSPQSLTGVETFSEKLRVSEKGFGFAGDTFIPPLLIKNGMDMKKVKVLRCRNFNKKKNVPGWLAVKVEVLE